MKGPLLLVACLILARTGSTQPPRATAILPGFRTPVWMDTTGQAEVLPGTAGEILARVDSVFRALQIPVEVSDLAQGLVGNGRIRTQRRFAGERMSSWLDCGAGSQGVNADVYRISMALLGMVRPVGGDSAELRVAFAAGAQAFSGPLGDPISCSSTGRLEERVLRAVRR